jgi:hypothetical protein
MTSTASSILTEASKIVDGARRSTHGAAERSFAKIATMWSAYLGSTITPVDVAHMMTLLKIARSQCGAENNADHYIDGAGYQALAGELAINGQKS